MVRGLWSSAAGLLVGCLCLASCPSLSHTRRLGDGDVELGEPLRLPWPQVVHSAQIDAFVALCNAGAHFIVSMGDNAALPVFAEFCPDGPLVVALALLEVGLAQRDSGRRAKSAEALGWATVGIADEHSPLAERCVSGLAALTLEDGDVAVRVKAAASLGQIALGTWEVEFGLAKSAVEALASQVSRDDGRPGEEVRRAAVEALGDAAALLRGGRGGLTTRCMSALSRALADSVAAVRLASVRTLARVASSALEAEPSSTLAAQCAALLSQRALDDQDFSVRLLAAEAVAVVASRAQSVQLRSKCILALADKPLRDHRFLGPIVRRRAIELLGDVAVNLAGRHPGEAARCVALLLTGLADGMADVRLRAAQILGKVAASAEALAGQCAAALEKAARRERDGEVREIAARAVSQANGVVVASGAPVSQSLW